MPTADDLEHRTAEYLEMLRQIRGGHSVAVNPVAAIPMAAVLKGEDDPLEQAAFQAALDLLAEETGAGKAAAEDSPAAARAALESADELLGTVAEIIERVVFRDLLVDGRRAAVVVEGAKLDVAAARRRIRAVLDESWEPFSNNE